MRSYKTYYLLVGLVMILLATAMPARAAEELIIETAKSELKPRARTKVEITAVNEDGNRIKENLQLLVSVSKGGVSRPKILEEGLELKEGKGEITYIAPSATGQARILLIDMATNDSAKQTFKIAQEKIKADWEEETAKITKIKGEVAVKKEEESTWDAALKGMTLTPGDSIKTWGDSWVTFELFDGSEIILKPWTTIYIKSLRRGKEKQDVKQSVMKIVTGNIVCNAQKYLTPGSKFEVETESSAAGIRGTNFEFALETNGAQDLIVYEGEVIFENFTNNKLFPVQAGQRLSIPSPETEQPQFDSHDVSSQEKMEELNKKQKKTKQPTEETSAPQSRGEEINQQGEKENKEEGAKENNNQQQSSTEEEQIETQESGESEAQDQETDEEDTATEEESNNLSKIAIGSKEVAEKVYLTLSWQPVFEDVLGSDFSTGLDLTFYQDPEDSDISLGPNAADENIDNIFNWLEYDGDLAYLYYGDLQGLSYGPNLLISNYEKEDAKGTQVEFNDITPVDLDWELLVPLDLKSISPWELRDSSTLYATRLATKFKTIMPVELGVNYVVDTNEELLDLPYEVPTKGVSADLKMQTTKLGQPHIEVAKLDGFGAGTEVGVKGRLSKLFWYDTGVRAMGEKFSPNYFGQDYEYIKENTLSAADQREAATDEYSEPVNDNDYPNSDYPNSDYPESDYPTKSAETTTLREESSARILPNLTEDHPATTGIYIKLGLNLELGKISVGYEDYTAQNRYAPVLTSQGQIDMPSSIPVPTFRLGYDYRQVEIGQYDEVKTSMLNRNTRFSWYLEYPLNQGVLVTLNNEFIPAQSEVEYTREVQLTFPF